MSVVALIMAAGRGSRFEKSNDLPKQYFNVGGIPILRHSINAFQSHPLIDNVLVVIHPDDIDLYEKATIGLDLLPPVYGGERRQDSVKLGLQALAEFSPKKILIHDAARAFVDKKIITAIVKQLDKNNAAIPAIPIHDTIKKCKEQKTLWTVDRTDLWKAQTPQGFLFDEAMNFHNMHSDKNFTDDASIYEYFGNHVSVVPGSKHNFKITTDEDHDLAEKIYFHQSKQIIITECRVGSGFDVHAFEDSYVDKYGNKYNAKYSDKFDEKYPDKFNSNFNMGFSNQFVTLGGIKISSDRKLVGHSDADVVLHAICDAIFGAIGEDDIGHHFSDKDPKWKGANSAIFLAEAKRIAHAKGAKINNIDVTIMCEYPKISSHRIAIKENIAQICRIDPSRVNVKATTTEKLGFLGRSEGIAAQAVVSTTIICEQE